MARKISDGWHVVAGYDVLVKHGQVIRGMRRDSNGQQVAAHIYRRRSNNEWTSVAIISYWAFVSAVRRGTVILS